MRSEINPSGQKEPSFIERARREQIIAAAIGTLAAYGWGAASLALIAAHAGISKGVISYHFAGKDELMEAIVESVYRGIAERVIPKIEGLAPTALVRAHIKAVAADLVVHRDELLALGEIIANQRTADGARRWSIADNDALYKGLERTYRAGQAAGEFRDFDTRVVAVTVQAALDSMLSYYVAFPGIDLVAYADQLAEFVVRAVIR